MDHHGNIDDNADCSYLIVNCIVSLIFIFLLFFSFIIYFKFFYNFFYNILISKNKKKDMLIMVSMVYDLKDILKRLF